MAAIAAPAGDSAQGIRIAYNAKQRPVSRTIWTSTMTIWCLGSHDRLRLVVIRFLRSLMPLKDDFRRDSKKTRPSSNTCLEGIRRGSLVLCDKWRMGLGDE